jgi:hypothetical protein
MKLNEEGPEFIIAFVNDTINGSCGDILKSTNFVLHCLNLSTAKIMPYGAEGCTAAYDRPACVFNRTAGELRYEYKDWFLSVEAGSVFRGILTNIQRYFTNQEYYSIQLQARASIS